MLISHIIAIAIFVAMFVATIIGREYRYVPALPYAAAIAGKLKAELIVFQAVTPGQHVHTIGGLDYVPFNEPLLETMQADSKKYLK